MAAVTTQPNNIAVTPTTASGFASTLFATLALTTANAAVAQQMPGFFPLPPDTVTQPNVVEPASVIDGLTQVKDRYASQQQVSKNWDLSSEQYNQLWLDIASAVGVPQERIRACRDTMDMAKALQEVAGVHVFIDRKPYTSSTDARTRYEVKGLFFLKDAGPATDIDGQEILATTPQTPVIIFVKYDPVPEDGYFDLAGGGRRVWRSDILEREIPGGRRSAARLPEAAPRLSVDERQAKIISESQTHGYGRYRETLGTLLLIMENGDRFEVTDSNVERILPSGDKLRQPLMVPLYSPERREVALGCLDAEGRVFARVPRTEKLIPNK
jgi:hypothetical protein